MADRSFHHRQTITPAHPPRHRSDTERSQLVRASARYAHTARRRRLIRLPGQELPPGACQWVKGFRQAPFASPETWRCPGTTTVPWPTTETKASQASMTRPQVSYRVWSGVAEDRSFELLKGFPTWWCT